MDFGWYPSNWATSDFSDFRAQVRKIQEVEQTFKSPADHLAEKPGSPEGRPVRPASADLGISWESLSQLIPEVCLGALWLWYGQKKHLSGRNAQENDLNFKGWSLSISKRLPQIAGKSPIVRYQT